MENKKNHSNDANEIMYKMAEFFLQKMFNYGLIELSAGEKAILLGEKGIDDPFGGDIEVYRSLSGEYHAFGVV